MGSLTPSLGRIVHVATPEGYNGATVQAAVVTRVVDGVVDAARGRMGTVNVMVLPDMNVPFGKEGIALYHTVVDAAADTSLPASQKCWWPERT